MRVSSSAVFSSTLAFAFACAAPRSSSTPPPAPQSVPSTSTPPPLATAAPSPTNSVAAPPPSATVARPGTVLVTHPPPELVCNPDDWKPQKLEPLLAVGTRGNPAYPDRPPVETPAFRDECTDAPGSVRATGAPDGPAGTSAPVAIDGVEVRLTSVTPAGQTGRHWQGNQCSFELRLTDGSGKPVALGPAEVPPFNAVESLVRKGAAVWLTVGYNGYAREFPKGGNRVLAVDLCEGKVVWKSPDSRSNSSLLLLGDYLLTSYGFTSERRFVYVLEPRSGAVVQKLPVVENKCPSTSWAPNYSGGRCDAPGQRVGSTARPRIEDMLFVVDTNTGSATFELQR